MERINKTATCIFLAIIAQLGEKSHKKFDSNKSYMPLIIERIGECKSPLGLIYSFAHYDEMNGDLMADPEMTFLVCQEKALVFPLSFRNDYVGAYQNTIEWNDSGKIIEYHPQKMADAAAFANVWMKNLEIQQGPFTKLVLTEGK